MDPLIQNELSKLDPTIPFRASTAHRHHTWAKTFHSRPELYIRPQTIAEIQKVVTLARRCRRRLVTVGCGHSPSDLTCTSSWMVNLDQYNRIISIDDEKRVVVMEAGIRLHDLGAELKKHGLAMPNLGSIDNQAIAGAIGTATHGSSTRHGLLSQSVLGLKIMLADGRTMSCSAEENTELFRAALVSLGALGIITEVTYQAVPAFDIEWQQSLHSLEEVMNDWSTDLWTTAEFTRLWWMPYMKRAIVWRGDKTSKPRRPQKQSWYGGLVGYHAYHILLYLAQWVPSLLPSIEKVVIAVQYGFTSGAVNTAVEDGHRGLLMNCLYSQFVNEWALPLARGPEAITRLSAWLNGDRDAARIPFDPSGLYVHTPIEVRVSDTSSTTPRPYLDNTIPDGPTLYINATLYRPYNRDPPCKHRYYEAFEWLMKELGGRPHWAKNFQDVSCQEFWDMYPDMGTWVRIRNEVDPQGMFLGDWHRRNLLPLPSSSPEGQGAEAVPFLPLEEHEVARVGARGGGLDWSGEVGGSGDVDVGVNEKGRSPGASDSEESFELVRAGNGDGDGTGEGSVASLSTSMYMSMVSASETTTTSTSTSHEEEEEEEEEEDL